jgi:arabinoxylan arabinofuranohydrolase
MITGHTMKNVSVLFKRLPVALAVASLSLCWDSGAQAAANSASDGAKANNYIHRGAGNPYLPLWEHLPDGEPRVFEDPDKPGKFRAYIIGSHDVRANSYCGPDIRAWSAPVEDLSTWRDEGPIFTYQIRNQWDVMYAPDLVEVKGKDGKKVYYLYPHSRGGGREAMVAKGDRPDGPFTPINMTEDGTRTVPGSTMGFDPAVYIDYITDQNDPDFEIGFRAYGFWGFQRSMAGQLDQKTMYSIRPGQQVIDRFIPASSRYGVIRDPQGTQYPNVYPDQDLGAFNFFEAASIRKIGNKYVWVYSGYSGPDYGVDSSNSTLRYGYGDSALGPWKTGGVLVDSRAVVLNQDGSKLQTTYAGHNTHGSIQLINDQYYVFYHRAPRGFGNARQAMVAPVKVEWDEKPVSAGGKVTISGFDPYAKDQVWTAKASQGHHYTGAEVTSEGFHIYGLDPYQYYSAGYACYLSNQRLVQDSWDMWDNNMPLAGVQNGNIIGFKYFGFGGLDKDQKGLKAFAGAKPGNKTAFNLFLAPKTTNAFKVNVWLDGPWDNATWKGKKIGEINVPAGAAPEVTQFTLDVAAAVENLKGKNALFLVAEGSGGGALCDIVGLGFSSEKVKIVRPVPPAISIMVNGQSVTLPANPVRSTNANGITGVDLYQATYAVPADVAAIPQVSATASDASVKVNIKQAEARTGTAEVKFDYKGVVKTYRVVFTSS